MAMGIVGRMIAAFNFAFQCAKIECHSHRVASISHAIAEGVWRAAHGESTKILMSAGSRFIATYTAHSGRFRVEGVDEGDVREAALLMARYSGLLGKSKAIPVYRYAGHPVLIDMIYAK